MFGRGGLFRYAAAVLPLARLADIQALRARDSFALLAFDDRILSFLPSLIMQGVTAMAETKSVKPAGGEQKREHFAIQKRHLGHFDSSRWFAPICFFRSFLSSLQLTTRGQSSL